LIIINIIVIIGKSLICIIAINIIICIKLLIILIILLLIFLIIILICIIILVFFSFSFIKIIIKINKYFFNQLSLRFIRLFIWKIKLNILFNLIK